MIKMTLSATKKLDLGRDKSHTKIKKLRLITKSKNGCKRLIFLISIKVNLVLIFKKVLRDRRKVALIMKKLDFIDVKKATKILVFARKSVHEK